MKDTNINTCLSDATIERWFAGECSAEDEAEAVGAHMESCVLCTGRLAQLARKRLYHPASAAA